MKPIEMIPSLIKNHFCHRLENIPDMRYELVKLAELIEWNSLTEEFGHLYSEGKGRSGKPIRLMAALVHLQHNFGLSGEEVVFRWKENPY